RGRDHRPPQAASASGRVPGPGSAFRQPLPVHRLRAHLRSGPASRRGVDSSVIIRAGLLVTGTGDEIPGGWLRTRDSFIAEIGSGAAPKDGDVLDLRGCVAVPGLVNSHDHLYQWATRGYAPDQGLFGWLTELYPVWARID